SARRAPPRGRGAASPPRRRPPPRAARRATCRRARVPSARPSGAHLDDAVLRPGHGALDEQQVALGVDVVDAQAELRHPLAAHAAGKLDALEDARRRRRGAHRAGGADVVRAVAARAAREVVALDRPLEALADPDPGDLDLVARLEDLDGDGLALDRALDRA